MILKEKLQPQNHTKIQILLSREGCTINKRYLQELASNA